MRNAPGSAPPGANAECGLNPLRDNGSDAVADTGDALGAELFSVYQAGSETIPHVAVLYRRVGSAIWRSGTATRPRTGPVSSGMSPMF